MTTKSEVSKVYDVDARGIIRSPGGYEGEPWWIVVVAEEWMGDGEILQTDEHGTGLDYVEIFDYLEGAEDFGLEDSTVAILYRVGSQGFQCVVELSPEERDLTLADYGFEDIDGVLYPIEPEPGDFVS